MDVAVLVPRRSDGGRRDEVWSWVRQRWATEHPDWPLFEGHHDDGPFNRSAALNQAARDAGDWDVAIIADSDSFVSVQQATDAAAVAHRTGQVTFAYDRFSYLSRRMSDRVMAGYRGDWTLGVEWTMTGTCSSMVAVPRGPWDVMGGADEGFVGWGGEDIAISLALQTFGGGMHRIHGDVWHLWHPPAAHTHDHVWPERMQRYADAAYDVDKMRALITELRAELVS